MVCFWLLSFYFHSLYGVTHLHKKNICILDILVAKSCICCCPIKTLIVCWPSMYRPTVWKASRILWKTWSRRFALIFFPYFLLTFLAVIFLPFHCHYFSVKNQFIFKITISHLVKYFKFCLRMFHAQSYFWIFQIWTKIMSTRSTVHLCGEPNYAKLFQVVKGFMRNITWKVQQDGGSFFHRMRMCLKYKDDSPF